MVADRHYTPAQATHDALTDHMQRTGVQRVVIVQPSFYGTDNRCMLDSLARLQGAGRGVAVVDRDVDARALQSLHESGVRGLRLNVESAGVRDVHALEVPLRYWAGRIKRLGWHLQVYASYATTAALAPVLDSLAVPVVLDHFAMVPVVLDPRDAELQRLLELLAGGNVYLKLSAPYRIAQDKPYTSAFELAQLYLRTNPERILWGSDWPHTNREAGKAAHEVSRYRDISAQSLLDSIHQWLPSAHWLRQVLVSNPSRLYGFSQ